MGVLTRLFMEDSDHFDRFKSVVDELVVDDNEIKEYYKEIDESLERLNKLIEEKEELEINFVNRVKKSHKHLLELEKGMENGKIFLVRILNTSILRNIQLQEEEEAKTEEINKEEEIILNNLENIVQRLRKLNQQVLKLKTKERKEENVALTNAKSKSKKKIIKSIEKKEKKLERNKPHRVKKIK